MGQVHWSSGSRRHWLRANAPHRRRLHHHRHRTTALARQPTVGLRYFGCSRLPGERPACSGTPFRLSRVTGRFLLKCHFPLTCELSGCTGMPRALNAMRETSDYLLRLHQHHEASVGTREVEKGEGNEETVRKQDDQVKSVRNARWQCAMAQGRRREGRAGKGRKRHSEALKKTTTDNDPLLTMLHPPRSSAREESRTESKANYTPRGAASDHPSRCPTG